MHYTRLDLRFQPRGWSGGILVEGAVAGAVRGVAVEADGLQVEYTLVQPRHRFRAIERDRRQVGTSRTTLAEGLIRLSRHTRVQAGETTVGWVAAAWCDSQSRALTHVLITPRRRLGSPTLRVVEAALISSIGDHTLSLKMTSPAVSLLPIYLSDTAIANALGATLEAALPDPRTRRSVKVRVEDAHVFLGGEVDTPEAQQRALEIAAGIPGVRGVTSDIIITESLGALVEANLARLLAKLPDAGAQVRAFTEHGIVYLEGRVPDAEARAALERGALSVPGVRVVVNNLLTPGEAPSRARDTGPLTRNK